MDLVKSNHFGPHSDVRFAVSSMVVTMRHMKGDDKVVWWIVVAVDNACVKLLHMSNRYMCISVNNCYKDKQKKHEKLEGLVDFFV